MVIYYDRNDLLVDRQVQTAMSYYSGSSTKFLIPRSERDGTVSIPSNQYYFDLSDTEFLAAYATDTSALLWPSGFSQVYRGFEGISYAVSSTSSLSSVVHRRVLVGFSQDNDAIVLGISDSVSAVVAAGGQGRGVEGAGGVGGTCCCHNKRP